MIPVEVNGQIYYKSSLSMKKFKCVGVRRENETIYITNTKTNGSTVCFTLEEWKTFIEGVKSSEFDNLQEE